MSLQQDCRLVGEEHEMIDVNSHTKRCKKCPLTLFKQEFWVDGQTGVRVEKW